MLKGSFNEELHIVLFFAAWVWVLLVVFLMRYLRWCHPTTYQDIGEPTLFPRGFPFLGRYAVQGYARWMEGVLGLSGYLLTFQWLAQGDRKLDVICGGMIAYIIAYICGFIWLLATIEWRVT